MQAVIAMNPALEQTNRLPGWFRQGLPTGPSLRTKQFISDLGLNTVCRFAICPNINDCFARKQAAFMILGDSCTRHCRFCNIGLDRDGSMLNSSTNRTVPEDEPQKIVEAVKALGLKYVVITSVTRDDLADGGASRFAELVELLRDFEKNIKVEVLIPDFQGDPESLRKVVSGRPFILAHNLETVKRLYPEIRPEASYQRSLDLLKKAKESSATLITKSSLMLGFGEREDEVVIALQDLRASGCDIVTLGQYLSPSLRHYPVKEFISPEQFRRYSEISRDLGFKKVFSGPKARSSYHAEEMAGELTYA